MELRGLLGALVVPCKGEKKRGWSAPRCSVYRVKMAWGVRHGFAVGCCHTRGGRALGWCKEMEGVGSIMGKRNRLGRGLRLYRINFVRIWDLVIRILIWFVRIRYNGLTGWLMY